MRAPQRWRWLWTRRRRGKSNVFGGRLEYARRNLQRRHPQCGNDLIRTEAANAVCAQQSFDALGSPALRNAGRWCELEQSPQHLINSLLQSDMDIRKKVRCEGMHAEARHRLRTRNS